MISQQHSRTAAQAHREPLSLFRSGKDGVLRKTYGRTGLCKHPVRIVPQLTVRSGYPEPGIPSTFAIHTSPEVNKCNNLLIYDGSSAETQSAGLRIRARAGCETQTERKTSLPDSG